MKLTNIRNHIYKNWLSIVLLTFALIIIPLNKNSVIQYTKYSIGLSASKVQLLLSSGSNYIANLRMQIDQYFDLETKNNALSLENTLLKDNIATLRQLAYENDELRKLNRFTFPKIEKILSTRIISQYDGNYIEKATILAGSNDSLKPDYLVVCGDGVIGKLQEVFPSLSQILLLTDPSSRVPIFFPRSREHAIGIGNHDELVVKYLGQTTEVAVGDVAITSGEGTIYPFGLTIGEVSQVTPTQIKIKPYFNQKTLNLVAIVRYKTDRR